MQPIAMLSGGAKERGVAYAAHVNHPSHSIHHPLRVISIGRKFLGWNDAFVLKCSPRAGE